MLTSKLLPPIYSNNPQPTTRIGGTVLLGLAFAMLVALFSATPARATLSVGSVTGQTVQSHCPAPGTHWLQYTTIDNKTHYMHCVAAEVTGCPNVQDIGLTYAI
jgi:hypothetical protein